MLHNHNAGHGGGDIETILSEINIQFAQAEGISPDPSEKRMKKNMENEAPEQVPALAYSREGNKKQVISSKNRRNQKQRRLFLLEQKGKTERTKLNSSSTVLPCSSSQIL